MRGPSSDDIYFFQVLYIFRVKIIVYFMPGSFPFVISLLGLGETRAPVSHLPASASQANAPPVMVEPSWLNPHQDSIKPVPQFSPL